MKLNDPLVESIEYNGQIYGLDLSFNRVLDVFDVLKDEELTDFEKASIGVSLLLRQEVLDFEQIIDLWSYLKIEFIDGRSEDPILYDRAGNPMPIVKDEQEKKRLLDFRVDAELIFASFLQAYGINLFKVQNELSWTEFRALLNALPENTVLQRVIAIRSWEPSEGETTEYKRKMRELQIKYRLDHDREEEDYGG